MSDIEHPASADRPDEPRPDEPRPEVVELVRSIGDRLSVPLPESEREALVATLADTARTGEGGSAAPVDELAPRRAARAQRLRRLSAAAAALVVIGGAVGIVNRAGDDLPVLVLADGASGSVAGAMAGDSVESMRAETSPMIGLWVPTVYTFELADGVTIDVPRTTAWRLVPPADVAASAAALAATLDLSAPTPTEWDSASLMTQTDGGASLWVSATGDWYYSGPSDLYPQWDCPEPDLGSDGSGDVREPVECTAPEPPANVPDAARARVLAGEFLARVGHADVRVLDVMVDEWGAYVQTELVLPGAATSSGVFVGVGFGAEGRVTWANGTLSRPEAIGDYPLIDLPAALERLEQDMNAWLDDAADGVVPMPRPMPADEGDTATSDAPRSDGDGPVSILPLPEPGVSEPGAPDALEDAPWDTPWEDMEPVERTVRIVSVELVTSVVWTTGDMYVLLPHYRLVDSEGGWWFVIAVEDRYVQR